MDPNNKIVTEFDNVAHLLEKKKPNIESKLRQEIIAALPPNMKHALEIGCGLGDFSRALAKSAEHVLAIDISPEMIRIARERSLDQHEIEFKVIDFNEWEAPVDYFDCVVCLMTLHYLPIEKTLVKIRKTLRPGGVLIVIDFYQEGIVEKILFKLLKRPFRKLVRKFSGQSDWRRKTSWADNPDAFYHTAMKTYSIKKLRAIYKAALPGSKVRRNFFSRNYSVSWSKV